MLSKLCIAGLMIVGVVLCVPQSWAQGSSGSTQEPVPPLPPDDAGRTPSVAKPGLTGAPVTQEDIDVPDSRSLVGAQNLSLGSSTASQNFLLPSFGVTTQVTIDQYQTNGTNNSDLISSTYLTGRLGLNRTSGRSQLMLDYLTGGSFSNSPTQSNSGIQSLDISDAHQWGRWSALFGDHFTYTAQSPFGFGGLGGLNNLGVASNTGGSNPDFRNGFLPNQSILIDGSAQISNAGIVETGYAFTPRSSMTLAASYGILDLIGNGYQNNSNVTLQGGYNYLLDRKDSIGVFYRYNKLMFTGDIPGVQDHSVQFTFARRITGHLTFQVGAGPDFEVYNSPLAGPSTVASWTVSSQVSYQYRRFQTGLNYDHYVTGGSGELRGAETDLVSVNISHALNENWQGTISGGFSRNQSLQQTTGNANTISVQSWFANAGASRNFVRYGSLFVSVGVSGQSNLAAICTQPACKVNSPGATVSIGYNWGLRPIVLH